MRRSRTTVVLALGAALVAAPGAGGATAPPPQKRTVTINDNFYAPAKLTVNRGSTVRWVWPEDTGDVHDVAVRARPRGEPRWASEPGAGGYTYKRVLRRPGRYAIVCTLHEEMTMTIVVRKG